MSDGRDGPRPPSSRDVAGEDFLFHLYRGSEMLQDNRVHDAKAELEQALSLQPRDSKGQDLLGIVYFRLGMYPRAIEIYERLIKAHPEAVEPHINLALSYLKTGQPQSARTELEKVVEQQPGHGRAWGYLGLAYQRLGDYERASHAFAAGGHDAMARRLLEMSGQGPVSLRPEPMGAERTEMRKAAGEAFQELERGDAFRPASDHRRIPSGTWTAIEPGREPLANPRPVAGPGDDGGFARDARSRPQTPGSLAPLPLPNIVEDDLVEVEGVDPGDAAAPNLEAPPPRATRAPMLEAQAVSSVSAALVHHAPRRAAEIARDRLLIFPRDHNVSLHASGVVLVRAPSGFATRLEAIRSISFAVGWTTNVLPRRMRGRLLDEPLGGAATSIVEVAGHGELVLAAPEGFRLFPVALEQDPFYVREDALVGFEPNAAYENGRLPVGDGEAIAMVQLRGPGTAVIALGEKAAALEVAEGRSAALHAGRVIGWVGRVVPRGMLASEAPAALRGFVSFAGEGMVLLNDGPVTSFGWAHDR